MICQIRTSFTDGQRRCDLILRKYNIQFDPMHAEKPVLIWPFSDERYGASLDHANSASSCF